MSEVPVRKDIKCAAKAPINRIKLVISDFHLSAGKWLTDGRRNPLEDFHQDDRFFEMLDHYSGGQYETNEVELIINGDFFDPLAVATNSSEFPAEVTEDEAVRKFEHISEAHPTVFEALKRFLKREKWITFLWGNHDAALLWPRVQEYLSLTLGAGEAERLRFLPGPYEFDGIRVEHGHQHEVIHHFDTKNLFLERRHGCQNTRILNLPFGSFFVHGFLNRLKLRRSYINQVQPFRLYLKIAFYLEPVFVVVNGLRIAWFFVKMRLITHPMRFARLKKTLLILLEVWRRPSLERSAGRFLHRDWADGIRIVIMGHDHQATHRIFSSGKEYVNTGTWTPITSLNMATLGHRTLRTYALIEYVENVPRVSLKVWNGPRAFAEDFI